MTNGQLNDLRVRAGRQMRARVAQMRTLLNELETALASPCELATIPRLPTGELLEQAASLRLLDGEMTMLARVAKEEGCA